MLLRWCWPELGYEPADVHIHAMYMAGGQRHFLLLNMGSDRTHLLRPCVGTQKSLSNLSSTSPSLAVEDAAYLQLICTNGCRIAQTQLALQPFLANPEDAWPMRFALISSRLQCLQILRVDCRPQACPCSYGNVINSWCPQERFKYGGGRCVSVCVPAMSLWEWHLFRLSSHPMGGMVTLHIRVLGD